MEPQLFEFQKWTDKKKHPVRLTSTIEVLKTVRDYHFIATRFIDIIPRSFRHVHTTSSAKLYLNAFYYTYTNIVLKNTIYFQIN